MPKGQWGGCLVLSVGGDWTLASLTPALRLLRPLTPVILPQKETLAGPALGVEVEQCAHVPWGGLVLCNKHLVARQRFGERPGSQGQWPVWGEGRVPPCWGACADVHVSARCVSLCVSPQSLYILALS